MSRRVQRGGDHSRQVQKVTTTTTTKKVELPEEDIENIRIAFDAFDTEGTGKIDISKVKEAMDETNFQDENPLIYQVIVELDTPANKNGVDYDKFLTSIDAKVNDKDSREGIRRVFEVIEPENESITAESLKKSAEESGIELTDEEIQTILEQVGDGDTEITFQQFYEVMSKKALP
jgi:Ca2+-binding EF-hand superfamily protein